MELLDGKLVSKSFKDNLKQEISKYVENNIRAPHIAIILVGNNDASLIYVRNKIKACTYIGMKSTLINLEDTISTNELKQEIKKLNEDEEVDGIIVQLPLPKHIDEKEIINYIDDDKDVDGFGFINKGKLFSGVDSFVPATPFGIIKLLEFYNLNLEGMNAVVIGRSNIVGKPMAMLLLNKNATVTICHSRTKDIASITKKADLIVVAVGKAKFLTADMVKENTIIVDVGMNRLESGLCGDVDFENVKEKASFITPVPGGVGPLTIAMLLENTFKAYKNKFGDIK